MLWISCIPIIIAIIVRISPRSTQNRTWCWWSNWIQCAFRLYPYTHHIDWMTGGHGGCEWWTTNCLSAAEYIRKTMRKCTKLNVRSAIEHHFIHIFYSIEIYWWFSARNFRSALCIGTKFDAAHSKPFQSTGICLFCVCT